MKLYYDVTDRHTNSQSGVYLLPRLAHLGRGKNPTMEGMQ